MKKALIVWFWWTVMVIAVGAMEGRFPGPINSWLFPLWLGVTVFVILMAVTIPLRRRKAGPTS